MQKLLIRLKKLSLVAFLCGVAMAAQATDNLQSDLSISMIRAVGDYQGTGYDNTFELWFTTPIVWPTSMKCTATYRVIVDAKNKHLIAAAYMAIATGKKVRVNVDDTLPIRDGSCEVSFLDMIV